MTDIDTWYDCWFCHTSMFEDFHRGARTYIVAYYAQWRFEQQDVVHRSIGDVIEMDQMAMLLNNLYYNLELLLCNDAEQTKFGRYARTKRT